MPLYQYRTKDRETTLLFIHVPKTGGTAIETYLRGIGLTGFFDPPTYMPVRPYLKVPPAHYDYGYLSRLFDLTKLYSFAVVRHPVRRMVSEYKWALEKSTLPGQLAQMAFSDYIRHMFDAYRRDENVVAGHFKPQIRFVGEKVTKIFKYESGLDNVLRHVLQDVGLKISSEMKLPVVNSTSSREVVPSDSDVDLIREVYAEDFKAFGYEPRPTEMVSQS
ncbi:MAG: sulfotransferase family 2 domain-containing protein [Aestuariivirga sp.]|uniref:sulfotransferase family 2 domain-containing protein n=1 Tax=Aestuariivirga sp. TaxID=2650926 RepID=UPI0030193A0A